MRITKNQYQRLKVLDKYLKSISWKPVNEDIAKKMHITPPAVNYLLNSLITAGAITRDDGYITITHGDFV